ncbi:LrgB family protein [Legionella sp. km772]|uniref:LrgB family protein n=1 Tax=Legionella sp. km772 TaxID=2498111 RepID=UPI000F8C8F24|nr:LrgB family protein [Legionella sp. km772]RUR09724.1 LrgB family protein [Legionella sp. km772]
MLHLLLNEPLVQSLFWSFVTVFFYFFTKQAHRLWPVWWLTPIALTPILIGSVVLLLHANYQDYFQGTRWLVLLIGPVTVSFAIPIYEQRALIREYWSILLVGVLVGSFIALLSSWGLAWLLGLDENLRLSLLPRSISTPFALVVSRGIGGTPDLTAIFVVLTGILGAIIGEFILARTHFNSALARGACLGAAAHAAGTAQARKMGNTEGAIASLIMILVGLFNVLVVPSIAYVLKLIQMN